MVSTRNTQRRLTARSAIASTLLGVAPPELPTRSLVATAELLGVAPGTARVAISRMVSAGELEATEVGYRLVSPALLARQARQEQSRKGSVRTWDGSWRMAVVTADARSAAARADLRAATAALRLAELREGVWLRPDNLAPGVLPDAERHVADQCLELAAHPPDGPGLAASLWDLSAWADEARALAAALERLADALGHRRPHALGEGFVTAAAALRHLQADPLLPVDLLPARWPGPALRDAYEAHDRAFKATLRSWLREQAPAVP